MIEHIRLINSQFNSNTYILSKENESSVWLVDPGDTLPVFEWINLHHKTTVAGILLTHTHFDHIYGVNDILEKFPECVIYVANDYGKEGLTNIKQNGSKYTGKPIVIEKTDNVRFFETEMALWPDVTLTTQITPGHSDDSICVIIDNLLFSGDTLIKDVRTVTKLKGGSVEKLNHTVSIIEQWKGNGHHICPGHGEEFELDNYDLRKVTSSIGSNQ